MARLAAAVMVSSLWKGALLPHDDDEEEEYTVLGATGWLGTRHAIQPCRSFEQVAGMHDDVINN